MSRKSFQVVAYASTFTFDADQSKNFQVTLTGSPTITIAGGQEGDEIGLLFIQGGSGGYTVTFPSNVTWASGQKPNFNSAVGGTDLITLVKRGSNWEDKAGAPSKLPSRLNAAALATITVVNIVATTLNLSSGTGAPSNITTVEDVRNVYAGTGSNKTMVIKEEGSGSILLSSSGANATGLGIGVPRLKSTSKITDANLYINAEGELTGSSATVLNTASGRILKVGGGDTVIDLSGVETADTLSGGYLQINKQGAGSGKVMVRGGAGSYFCLFDNDVGGWTQVSALNGVLIANIANATTCP